MQNAIPASQRSVSITKTDRLPLYMEIVATYCETYVKRKYRVFHDLRTLLQELIS